MATGGGVSSARLLRFLIDEQMNENEEWKTRRSRACRQRKAIAIPAAAKQTPSATHWELNWRSTNEFYYYWHCHWQKTGNCIGNGRIINCRLLRLFCSHLWMMTTDGSCKCHDHRNTYVVSSSRCSSTTTTQRDCQSGESSSQQRAFVGAIQRALPVGDEQLRVQSFNSRVVARTLCWFKTSSRIVIAVCVGIHICFVRRTPQGHTHITRNLSIGQVHRLFLFSTYHWRRTVLW